MSRGWGTLSAKNKMQVSIQFILLRIMVVVQRWAFDPIEKCAMVEAHGAICRMS